MKISGSKSHRRRPSPSCRGPPALTLYSRHATPRHATSTEQLGSLVSSRYRRALQSWLASFYSCSLPGVLERPLERGEVSCRRCPRLMCHQRGSAKGWGTSSGTGSLPVVMFGLFLDGKSTLPQRMIIAVSCCGMRVVVWLWMDALLCKYKGDNRKFEFDYSPDRGLRWDVIIGLCIYIYGKLSSEKNYCFSFIA